jgi:membrane protease YdiL (CAAX protease family)
VAPQPIRLSLVALLFAATSAPIYFAVYVLVPIVEARGYTFLTSYLICFYPTFAVLLILSIVLYRREGNPLSWRALKARYRLRPLSRRDWAWVLGSLIVAFLAAGILSPTAKWLAGFSFFRPPANLPSEMNPLRTPIPDTFMATYVRGHWEFAVAYFVGWFFNIFGEEFLWVGYILPRQEATYGRIAWLVHGLLWTAWHIYWRWYYLTLLPVFLGLPFVVQRTKNTTVSMVVHGFGNLVPLGLLVYQIAK